MLDFMDSDEFIIGLEIVFLIFIIYDYKQYQKTKKREYIVNIVLAVVFAIWTLMPFYRSYFEWNDAQKNIAMKNCEKENNATLCKCITKAKFKEFTYLEYKKMDINSTDYLEFIKDAKEECLDDGWF